MIQTNHGARMDFQELLTEVKRRREHSIDVVADARNVQYAVNDEDVLLAEILTGDSDVIVSDVTDHALGQMATHTKMGTRYAKILRDADPELLAHNLNKRTHAIKGKKLYRRLDDTIKAFLSDGYNTKYSDIAMMKGAWLGLKSNDAWQLHEATFTERRLSMRLMMPLVTVDVKVNDPVSLGIGLVNSEVGDGALSAALIMMRLVCLNGMVIPQKGLRKIHIGARSNVGVIQLSQEAHDAAERAVMFEIAETIEHLSNEDNFRAVVASMSETADAELHDPVAATQLLSKMGGLSDEEEKAMLNSFMKESDVTVWGALNAVTDMSRDLANYDRKVQLEEFAGGLAVGGRKAWGKLVEARA